MSRRIFKGSISRSHTEYGGACGGCQACKAHREFFVPTRPQCQRFGFFGFNACSASGVGHYRFRSEEHTSELQSRFDLVCRLLLEKKKTTKNLITRAST